MKIAGLFGAVIAVLLAIAALTTAGWVHPPIIGKQAGFRGVSMIQLTTPAAVAKLDKANALPDPIVMPAPEGPKATEVYKNVQVLKDLTAIQFNTLMAAMTQWVSPKEGCNYCHTDDLADDSVYAKKVSRRMIEMTRHVNTQWKSHVAATGVVCWTCHRGEPIPRETWQTNPGWPRAGGFAATNYGMGHPNAVNGSTSMSQDPFTPLFDKAGVVRIQSGKALPVQGKFGAPLLTTYQTYSLMIAMSNGMGVNCTFCHNTREFGVWEESTPQRLTAWHGINLVRDLNTAYLDPLKGLLPATRLGPTGDAPKANCATCHQGASKPLLGVSLAKDFPELGGTPAAKK